MKGNFFLGIEGDKRFEIRDMEFPALGPYDVLVENKVCGVCGTDIHIYHGEPGSAEVEPPVVLGHEFSGVVKAVGDKVTVVTIGDHVTVDPNMYCGICTPCRMGKKQNCQHLTAIGVNYNGGFAQGCLVPETQCFKLDPSVSFEEGAMAEPLACVVHGADLAGIHHGQTVLVIGGGPIGLLMVQMARLAGATCVILSEPVEMRRKIGLELGADAAIDPINEDICGRIKEICGRDGADVVIECVGKPFAVEQAFAAADYGAFVLLFSVPSVGTTAQLPLYDVFKKELKISGSMINPDTHQRAVNLINSGRIETKKLITHTFDMEHLEDAIKMQMSPESIKVQVKM